MKKLLIPAIAAVAAISGLTGYQAQQTTQSQLSDLEMENINALTDVEGEAYVDYDKACGGAGDGCAISGGYWFDNKVGFRN